MTVKDIKAMIEGMSDDDKIEIFTKKVTTHTDPWSGHNYTETKWTQIRKNIYIVKMEKE